MNQIVIEGWGGGGGHLGNHPPLLLCILLFTLAEPMPDPDPCPGVVSIWVPPGLWLVSATVLPRTLPASPIWLVTETAG